MSTVSTPLSLPCPWYSEGFWRLETTRHTHYSAVRWEEREVQDASLYYQREKTGFRGGVSRALQEVGANSKGLSSEKRFRVHAAFFPLPNFLFPK